MAVKPHLVENTPEDAPWRPDEMKLPTARGVLSAAEIEMLLRPDLPDELDEPPSDVRDRTIDELGDPKREALKKDAAFLAAKLTLASRRDCDIDAVFTVEDAFHADFPSAVSHLETDAIMVAFEGPDGLVAATMGLSRDVAVVLIDQVYGGGAAMGLSSAERPREFSALDRLVLERVLSPLAEALEAGLRISCIETTTTTAAALLPPGDAAIAVLTCQIGTLSGTAVFAKLDTLSNEGAGNAPSIDRQSLQTTLIARIASLQVPVGRLSNLKAGSTLLLGLPTSQPVELLSGSRSGPIVAEGEVGRKGQNMAIRITRRSRIAID